jgi:hypothetical protein
MWNSTSRGILLNLSLPKSIRQVLMLFHTLIIDKNQKGKI